MSLAVPESTLTSEELARLALFDGELAAALDEALADADSDVDIGVFNVRDYGAVGDGVTDDKAAIQAAITAALAAGRGNQIVFPGGGTYRLASYIDINGADGLSITGTGSAIIEYPSDDTSLVASGIAVSDAMARSGFIVRNSTGVSFYGLTFQGGTNSQITTTNIGVGVYATSSSSMLMHRCIGRDGYHVFAQDGNDTDVGARIDGCQFYGCRGVLRTGNDALITGCYDEMPGNPDATGVGDAFTKSGSVVTLTDYAGKFESWMDQRYIVLSGSTTPGNNGAYKLTYISTTQVSYTNASGAEEAFTGKWWVPGGEKGSLGAGASAISVSGTTVTLTSAEAIFVAGDLNKAIRVAQATTDANDCTGRISEVVSSTQVKFDNPQAGATTEAYTGPFTVDGYDNVIDSGNTYGSTHGVYLFAGRRNVQVVNCTFKHRRTTCFKASGSSLPVTDLAMRGCVAIECGSLAVLGADDSQIHENFIIESNIAIDCATNRRGWSESVGVFILGARGVRVVNNSFHYSRNSIRSVDGSASLAGLYGIQATRYVEGASQPIEDVTIANNKFTVTPANTTSSAVLIAAIALADVGLLQRHGTGGSLTKSGNVMTLTAGSSLFSKELVGATLNLVNTTGSNDGSFVIASVPTSSTLTYVNAGGTGGGNNAGTWRIGAAGGKSAGACLVTGNTVLSAATTGVLSEGCVAPEINGNVFRGCEVLVQFEGDVSPSFRNNREIGRASDTAGIRFNGSGLGVSWPIVGGNVVTNNAIGPARGWGMHIGINGGTPVDYPLLGMCGRVLPSDGKEEVVIAYGSRHVDGDTITVDDGSGSVEVYTYKATGPTGNQFNDFAGLVALIAAQTGIDCTDYGTGFEDSAGSAANVTTYHLRIRAAAATANTDGTLVVTCSALYPTALVALPNNASPNTTVGGRGSGSAGPTADKIVIWSPLCSFDDCPVVIGDNAAAQAVLVSDGYRKLSQINGRDGGSNDLITTGTTAGTEQWRWRL